MTTAYFQYKCRYCGEIFSDKDCNEEFAGRILINSLHNLDNNLVHPEAQKIPLTTTHSCRNKFCNQIGIADLIGYYTDK
jgi:hypothetical protein